MRVYRGHSWTGILKGPYRLSKQTASRKFRAWTHARFSSKHTSGHDQNNVTPMQPPQVRPLISAAATGPRRHSTNPPDLRSLPWPDLRLAVTLVFLRIGRSEGSPCPYTSSPANAPNNMKRRPVPCNS